MTQLVVELLGTPVIRLDDHPVTFKRRKTLALVSYLAIMGERRRDELSTLLWQDQTQSNALASLRQTLADMRRQLTDDNITITRSTLALSTETLFCDALSFQQHLNQYKQTRHITHLEAAVALYRNNLLTGFSLSDAPLFDDWQSAQSQYYFQQQTQSLDNLARHYQEIDQPTHAIRYARQLLNLNRLNESVHRLLMRLYVQNRQPDLAMNQYLECLSILREEMGVEPQPATRQLYQELLKLQVLPEDTDPLISTKHVVSLHPPEPSLIVGRMAERLRFKKALIEANYFPTESPFIVLQGQLGIGKTTLLNQLAYDEDIRQIYRDGVLWVALNRDNNIHTELSTWGKAFNINVDHLTIDELSTQIRGAIHRRRMLILIDGITRIEQVYPFLVAGQQSATVIATRYLNIAQELAPVPQSLIQLEAISPDAARELLTLIMPEAAERYADILIELVSHYQSLPLALQIAGRTLENELLLGFGAQDMLDDLLDTDVLLQQRLPIDYAYYQANNTRNLSQLLAQQLTQLPDTTQTLLAQLIHNTRPNERLHSHRLKELADRDTIRLLRYQGMLQPADDESFQIPILWYLYLQSVLNSEE